MGASAFRETFSEHVVEVRYKPNPVLLDSRGERAKQLMEKLKCEHWQVAQEVIRVMREDEKGMAFVGFRNAGTAWQDLADVGEFVRKGEEFCRALYSLPGAQKLDFKRVGVRSRLLRRYEGTFESLRELFMERCLGLKDGLRTALGGEITDVGAPVNGSDGTGNYNTHSGPMEEKQARQFLKREHGFGPVNLYVDVDYWVEEIGEMPERSMVAKVAAFARAGWEKCEKVIALVGGE